MSSEADQGWVVLELNSRSDGEDPEIVAKSIRGALGQKAEVFLPAEVTEIGGDRAVHYLVGGYAFVRHTLDEAVYTKLENTRFVQSALTGISEGKRRLAIVPTTDIDRMRHQLKQEVDQGIGVGDKVLITTGAYRNIEAAVIEEIPERDEVQVHVSLRSKQAIVTLPRSGLQVIERAPLSPIYSKVTALKTWLRFSRPIAVWMGNIKPLRQTFKKYEKLSTWMRAGHNLYAQVSFGGSHHNLGHLVVGAAELERVNQWHTKLVNLFAFVASYQGYVSEGQLRNLQSQFVELLWIDDVIQRIRQLRRDVEAIAHAEAGRKDGGGVFQNLLIDGHNLAIRCLYAPGLDTLTDSQGRPTGAIVGFIRTLGSLRKKHPDARIYVTWDGSNKRRQASFPDYKGNRRKADPAATKGFDQFAFLRQTLPMFGVWQGTNPDEEADDIIAALAREELRGQNNLIFSTDRDLLQLVTETTLMLVPGVGGRKDAMFDQAAVEKTFGVPPERIVQLRSFFGDPSDNIPGVPRVPKKVLRSLVQAHKTVDGVYASGLTGITKSQYEKLRGSEPQVRINVGLMTLLDVPVSITDPNVDADTAATRLQELSINSAPLLEPFFGLKQKKAADT